MRRLICTRCLFVTPSVCTFHCLLKYTELCSFVCSVCADLEHISFGGSQREQNPKIQSQKTRFLRFLKRYIDTVGKNPWKRFWEKLDRNFEKLLWADIVETNLVMKVNIGKDNLWELKSRACTCAIKERVIPRNSA